MKRVEYRITRRNNRCDFHHFIVIAIALIGAVGSPLATHAMHGADGQAYDSIVDDTIAYDSVVYDTIANGGTVGHMEAADSDSVTFDSIAEAARIEAQIQQHLLTIDSLTSLYEASLTKTHNNISKRKTAANALLNNPYYFNLFASPTLYNATIRRKMGYTSWGQTSTEQNALLPWELIDGIDNALKYVYTTHPEIITHQDTEEQQGDGLRNDVNGPVAPQVNLSEKAPETMKNKNTEAEEWDIVVYKPNFWKFKTDLSLQFMQNYVSDNWYKGGDNHNSWKAEATLEANYDNKQKLIFTNKLEMRLGFQSSQGDEKHKYRSNSDLIRMTNKLGLQATKHWYYTFTLQSWTQFYPGYKKNDDRVYSDFMSPFDCLASIGMDYKLSLKKFSINASISPFAGKFRYVDRNSLTASMGLKNNNHAKLEYGSNITINYTWNICKNISWNSRIYYFTDYSKAQIEWENTFNLKINKFLSTKLFLYPRFDDSVNRQEGDSYFQFNETLSIGFNYSF